MLCVSRQLNGECIRDRPLQNNNCNAATAILCQDLENDKIRYMWYTTVHELQRAHNSLNDLAIPSSNPSVCLLVMYCYYCSFGIQINIQIFVCSRWNICIFVLCLNITYRGFEKTCYYSVINYWPDYCFLETKTSKCRCELRTVTNLNLKMKCGLV